MTVPKHQESRNPPQVGRRSHYQFKNWLWDQTGHRVGARSVRPNWRCDADLVSSAYFNPGRQTETVYCLVFDLDAHRADRRWKTRTGKLQWYKIRKLLSREVPEVFRHIFAVVRSTGGKGLALAVAISPLELVDSTQKCQNAAKVLQWKLVCLFRGWGLGADPSALGLARDFPNWLDSVRKIFVDRLVLQSIQCPRLREPVITNLLAELSKFPELDYQKKRDRSDLLHYHKVAEPKLAKLFQHLLNNFQTDTVMLTTKDIHRLTGLSPNFVRKFFKNPSSWLEVHWINKQIGWQVRLRPTKKLIERVWELLDIERPVPQISVHSGKHLKQPEQVRDGERNSWLARAVIKLKHGGVPESQAALLMDRHVRKMPGYLSSRNCRMIRLIVRSIYKNSPHLFGTNRQSIPGWLVSVSPPLNPSSSTNLAQLTSFFKKGLGPRHTRVGF